MEITRNIVDTSKFNHEIKPPYELRWQDFQMAMQDVYDFFFDVNFHLFDKGLQRFDDMLRKNPRGELGTRTATLHKDGVKKLRDSWIYRL